MVAGGLAEDMALAVQQHRHAVVELHRALTAQFPDLAAIQYGLCILRPQRNYKFLFRLRGHGQDSWLCPQVLEGVHGVCVGC